MKHNLLFLLITPILSSNIFEMIAMCHKDDSCPSQYKGIVCSKSGFELNGCAESQYCSSSVVAPFRIKACDKDYAGK